ncbi:hypothetical protein BGZ61DRAFT_473604 [Ilyonectria robusta]|uniref:uncharacterized protein n=1 Tax=Ilyonectria robusta TaxID=1079257 RepID=UPI001E8EF26E|nr:uncharacterized protein BGZ61DRAFT_473604 [Ilyonectria robusta]KAH8734945.1 hypothetical protein BGZ61DRAFT_473604 [Ilyonectria robusta]
MPSLSWALGKVHDQDSEATCHLWADVGSASYSLGNYIQADSQSVPDGNGDSNGSPLWTMQHDWRWISRWRWLRCQLPTRASRLAGKFAAGGAAVISSSARGAGGTREHVKEKQREVSRDSLGSAVYGGSTLCAAATAAGSRQPIAFISLTSVGERPHHIANNSSSLGASASSAAAASSASAAAASADLYRQRAGINRSTAAGSSRRRRRRRSSSRAVHSEAAGDRCWPGILLPRVVLRAGGFALALVGPCKDSPAVIWQRTAAHGHGLMAVSHSGLHWTGNGLGKS